MGKLNDCKSISLGCFYKHMCHSACVCSEWKAVNCGGKVGELGSCAADALLKGNGGGLTERNNGSGSHWASLRSLDTTVNGKCG